MTSAVFFKELKEDIRQRIWIAVLILAVGFLIMPLAMYYSMNGTVESVRDGFITAQSSAGFFFQTYRQTAGTEALVVAAATAVAGIIAAVTGFSWLGRQESVDFWHSVAVDRKFIFLERTAAGFILCVVPYLINWAAATFLVPAAFGAFTSGIVTDGLKALLLFILSYLAFYFTVTLGLMMSGKVGTGLLTGAILLLEGPALSIIVSLIRNSFFDSIVMPDNHLSFFLSPVTILFGVVTQELSFRAVLAIAAYAAAGLVLGLIAYICRPSEAAGSGIVFGWTSHVLRIVLVVSGAFLLDLVMGTEAGAAGQVIIMAAGAFLASLLYELIYYSSLRHYRSVWKEVLAALAASVVLMLLCLYDPAGLNSWIPDGDEVDEAAVSVSELSSYGYALFYPDSDELLVLDGKFTDRTDVIAKLSDAAVTGGEDQTDGENLSSVLFGWKLKDGRTVYRNYNVPLGTLDEFWQTCAEDEELEALYNPVTEFKNKDDTRNWEISSIYSGEEMTLHLSDEEAGELRQAMISDSERILPSETTREMDALFVISGSNGYTDEYGNNNTTDTYDIYIYSGYEETLTWLEDHGYGMDDGYADIEGSSCGDE